MRSLSSSPGPALPVLHPLALILAGVAAPVWGVAGLTLGLNLLVRGILLLALWASLSLVLAPLVLACSSCPDCAGVGYAGRLACWSRGPGSVGAGCAGPGCAGVGFANPPGIGVAWLFQQASPEATCHERS